MQRACLRLHTFHASDFAHQVQKFEELLLQQRELFAEESLKGAFPKLVAFVVQVSFGHNTAFNFFIKML